MSRIKMLLDVIEDVRSLGDSLQALADAIACDEAKEEPKKKSRAKAEPPKEEGAAPTEAEPEERPLTLEEVRAVLAEKSRAGHTAEVKALLTKHGADKLSDVDPAEYPALLAETEAL